MKGKGKKAYKLGKERLGTRYRVVNVNLTRGFCHILKEIDLFIDGRGLLEDLEEGGGNDQ